MKEAKALEVILIRLLLTSVCVPNTVSEEFIENPDTESSENILHFHDSLWSTNPNRHILS